MKNRNKKIMTLLTGLVVVLVVQGAFASSEQERIYLLQLLCQIDAMQPTLLAAQKEQPKDARVQFHYTGYRDGDGQWHNGVSDDLKLIQTGIQEKLDHLSIEPRSVTPIKGDYLDSDKGK